MMIFVKHVCIQTLVLLRVLQCQTCYTSVYSLLSLQLSLLSNGMVRSVTSFLSFLSFLAWELTFFLLRPASWELTFPLWYSDFLHWGTGRTAILAEVGSQRWHASLWFSSAAGGVMIVSALQFSSPYRWRTLNAICLESLSCAWFANCLWKLFFSCSLHPNPLPHLAERWEDSVYRSRLYYTGSTVSYLPMIRRASRRGWVQGFPFCSRWYQ